MSKTKWVVLLIGSMIAFVLWFINDPDDATINDDPGVIYAGIKKEGL